MALYRSYKSIMATSLAVCRNLQAGLTNNESSLTGTVIKVEAKSSHFTYRFFLLPQRSGLLFERFMKRCQLATNGYIARVMSPSLIRICITAI